MAKGEERYIIKSVVKGYKVEHWMIMGGDPLEWKTTMEVATGVGLSQNEAYRQLVTLKSQNRVEQSDKGWRSSPEGIIRYSIFLQDHLNKLADRYGLRRPGQ